MMLAPWKESYDQPRQHVKKQRHELRAAARAAETQKQESVGRSSGAAVRVAGERGSGAAAGDGESGRGSAARERRAGRRCQLIPSSQHSSFSSSRCGSSPDPFSATTSELVERQSEGSWVNS